MTLVKTRAQYTAENNSILFKLLFSVNNICKRIYRRLVMKAVVDRDGCIGCTLCASICPTVFQMEDGLARAIDGDIPQHCIDEAVDAQESCPVSVISVK